MRAGGEDGKFFLFLRQYGRIAVTRVNLRVIGQDEEPARDRTYDSFEVCGRIGPARAMGKEGVSGKEMLPYQKAETAGGVTGGVKDRQPHISKRHFLAILKQDLRLYW